jgi:superfamily II DNA or RNA helicase
VGSARAGVPRTCKLLVLTEAKRDVLRSLLHHHRDGRVLVFTADNDAAYEIAREFLIMPITCDIGRGERDEALAHFRSGELHALVSARVLNEGLDVPDAEVAIVVGGSLGEREHVQRVGRLLRPRVGKRALVYDLVSRRTGEVRESRRRRAALGSRVTASV